MGRRLNAMEDEDELIEHKPINSARRDSKRTIPNLTVRNEYIVSLSLSSLFFLHKTLLVMSAISIVLPTSIVYFNFKSLSIFVSLSSHKLLDKSLTVCLNS